MEPNKEMTENMMANASEMHPCHHLQAKMAYQAVYPEIFYKLQPYVLMVCDQMDTYGSIMPTKEMIEDLSDHIHDDVCRMHPDIAEYARRCDDKEKSDPADDPPDDPPIFAGRGRDFDFDFDMFGRRRRRRGVLRDLIDILLLSEFFRRRRRF